MTREEVVKWLESLKNEIGKAENRTLWHYAESIDMAIKALKAKTDGDLIGRSDAIDACCRGWNNTAEDCIRNIKALPSAEAIHKPDYSYEAGMVRRLKEALSAAEPKTGRDCTDFVRWLMDEVMDEENWQMNAVANGEIICRKLKKLGLLDVVDGYYVETQKTGEWVRHELWDTPWYTCSECDSHGRNDYKFCPNCGARMLGEDGEE